MVRFSPFNFHRFYLFFSVLIQVIFRGRESNLKSHMQVNYLSYKLLFFFFFFGCVAGNFLLSYIPVRIVKEKGLFFPDPK